MLEAIVFEEILKKLVTGRLEIRNLKEFLLILVLLMTGTVQKTEYRHPKT